MSSLQQKSIESFSLQPRMQPLRQWPRLKSDPLHRKTKRRKKATRDRSGQSGGGGVGFCASARVGPAAVAMRSERPVHSAEQPAHPKRHYRHSIGLGLDSPAKPLVKSDSGVASGVCCLAVQVLGGPRRLIELSRIWVLASPVRRPTPSSILPPTFLTVPDMRSSSMVAVLPVMAGAAYFAPLFVSHAT